MTSSLHALGFIFVDRCYADIHKFKLRSCFIPYLFYSKIGMKMGASEFSITVKSHLRLQLKLREITPKMLL